MTNFVILIQFLAADARFQPNQDMALVLVDWVEDIILFIKIADRSWKKQMDQNTQWFCFHVFVAYPISC